MPTELDSLPSTQTCGTAAPAQAASSVAGEAFTVFASDATAGSTNAGAAAGGDLNLQGGDAKRLTSGNANGGNVVAEPGAAIGTGTAGKVIVRQPGGTPGTDEVQIYHDGTIGYIANIDSDAQAKLYIGSPDFRVTDRLFTAARLRHVSGAFQLNNSAICISSGDPASVACDISLWRPAAGVLAVGSGAGSGAGWLQATSGRSRVTTSNVTNVTITPANITGLSATVIAGRKYAGTLVLYYTAATAADGLRLDYDGGTATMTSFVAQGHLSDDNGFQAIARTTALATDTTNTTVTGSALVVIRFAFVVNAAGTFIPRFAKEADAAGATGTVLVDSHMLIEDLP